MSELPATVQVSSQTRHNLVMAVKEAVHNIIKHAKASEVTLSAAYDGWTLVIGVRDNGCGFSEGHHHAGSGLGNMRRRLTSLGGRCTVDSAPGTGTLVELRLEVRPPPQ
jgi:signal transduction histidine kinase